MTLLNPVKRHVPLTWRKQLKWLRARGFERVGSLRYSRPALYDLEASFVPLLPSRGVFLEIGANDGFDQSNTYYLGRHLGWRGILVEPLRDRYETCRRRRPEAHCVWAACVDPAYPSGKVQLADNDLVTEAVGLTREAGTGQPGRMGRRVSAPATTLSQVIAESPFEHVDFMSIDVEGAEMNVLAGLDMAVHTPGVLLIETHDISAVEAALEPWMRRVAQPTHHDYLFVRRDRSQRAAASHPPEAAERHV
jgi:FkbM family methyltransferase